MGEEESCSIRWRRAWAWSGASRSLLKAHASISQLKVRLSGFMFPPLEVDVSASEWVEVEVEVVVVVSLVLVLEWWSLCFSDVIWRRCCVRLRRKLASPMAGFDLRRDDDDDDEDGFLLGRLF